MIAPHELRIAEYVIDESGAVDLLIAGIRRDKRGRKTDPANYRLFLVGALLTIVECGNCVVQEIHETLTRRIPLDDQHRLGVRRWKTDHMGNMTLDVLNIHDLYNVTKTLSARLDYGNGTQPDLDDEERGRRHGVIQSFCDQLMDVFDFGWSSNTYALDATGIWSWGRGNGVGVETSAEEKAIAA